MKPSVGNAGTNLVKLPIFQPVSRGRGVPALQLSIFYH